MCSLGPILDQILIYCLLLIKDKLILNINMEESDVEKTLDRLEYGDLELNF